MFSHRFEKEETEGSLKSSHSNKLSNRGSHPSENGDRKGNCGENNIDDGKNHGGKL
ncbi:MAG: hypothetical protein RLZZ553_1299 [Verrucomicrobiota bacterium]|jgi:hypothetical protein